MKLNCDNLIYYPYFIHIKSLWKKRFYFSEFYIRSNEWIFLTFAFFFQISLNQMNKSIAFTMKMIKIWWKKDKTGLSFKNKSINLNQAVQVYQFQKCFSLATRNTVFSTVCSLKASRTWNRLVRGSFERWSNVGTGTFKVCIN